MWLSFLSKMHWVIWVLAIVIAAFGVLAVAQGRVQGLIAIGIALAMVVTQHYINKEASRSDVDPRDTIG